MKSDTNDIGHEKVTYTYTAPSGSIIVVRNVPALVDTSSGKRDIAYEPGVARHLQALVKAQLADVSGALVRAISFDESPVLPAADYAIEFIGPKAVFANASLQTWRLVFDKAYTAVKNAMRGVGATAMPTVAFLAPASIIVGIKTGDQRQLFDVEHAAAEPADRAIRLLIDTARWLDEEIALPEFLKEDDAATEALLRAVEDLAPADDETSVKLSRIGFSEASTFTRKTREKAREQRIAIRLKDPEVARSFELVATIARLDVKGDVVIRNIERHPIFKGKSATCHADESLIPTLLENFGRLALISVIQRRIGGRWSSKLELIDLIRNANDRDAIPESMEVRTVQGDIIMEQDALDQ